MNRNRHGTYAVYSYMVKCNSMRKRFHGMNLGLAIGKLMQIFRAFGEEITSVVDQIQIIMLTIRRIWKSIKKNV